MVDKIKLLEHRLREVADKFNALKKCGIDEEILIFGISFTIWGLYLNKLIVSGEDKSVV